MGVELGGSDAELLGRLRSGSLFQIDFQLKKLLLQQ